jgi:hypothetical protein
MPAATVTCTRSSIRALSRSVRQPPPAWTIHHRRGEDRTIGLVQEPALTGDQVRPVAQDLLAQDRRQHLVAAGPAATPASAGSPAAARDRTAPWPRPVAAAPGRWRARRGRPGRKGFGGAVPGLRRTSENRTGAAPAIRVVGRRSGWRDLAMRPIFMRPILWRSGGALPGGKGL